jgi:hypothetical protein
MRCRLRLRHPHLRPRRLHPRPVQSKVWARCDLLKFLVMENLMVGFAIGKWWRAFLLAAVLCVGANFIHAQATAAATAAQATPVVPDWAQPGSATHTQVPPPADFHRASTNFDTPIGVFDGQSDIGSAVVPGSASYDPATKQYTIICFWAAAGHQRGTRRTYRPPGGAFPFSGWTR